MLSGYDGTRGGGSSVLQAFVDLHASSKLQHSGSLCFGRLGAEVKNVSGLEGNVGLTWSARPGCSEIASASLR